jgi:hypothetical protein
MDDLVLDNLSVSSDELAAGLKTLVVDGSEKIRDYSTYITLRKFDTECTITAEWTFVFGDKGRYIHDNQGNEFIRSTLRVTVSHQSQSMDDLDLVIDRVKFILACCEAAKKLEAAHQDKKVYQVWETVEDKAKKLHERTTKDVAYAIHTHVGGMRVTNSRSICDGNFSDRLVPGDYIVEIGVHKPKKYRVTVSDSKVMTVTRTA